MGTTDLRVATVFCARVTIVASKHAETGTVPLLTSIGKRACVTVIAVVISRTEDAVTILACFRCARIGVIAVERASCLAYAIGAAVACRAGISIATGTVDDLVFASTIEKAAILRAWVVVITCQASFPLTASLRTGVA